MEHDLIIITSDNQLNNKRDYVKMYLNGDSMLSVGDSISFPTKKGIAIGIVVDSEHNGSFITIRVK